MSFGLNNSFRANIQAFLQNHAITTVMMSSQQHRPPKGLSNSYDLVRSDVDNDTSVTLFHSPGGNQPTNDGLISAYWLPQGDYIEVSKNAPEARYIFTPELSGCKIYVDQIPGNKYRVFHIQCPHEAQEYTPKLSGERRGTVDSEDYGGAGAPIRIATVRANVILHFNAGSWTLWLQGLTGIGPGMGSGGNQVVRPPGPVQSVNGVSSKIVV